MKLGDFVEKVINIITLGTGKKIAMWVAKLRGEEDCGCDARKDYLNELSTTKPKPTHGGFPTPPPTPSVQVGRRKV